MGEYPNHKYNFYDLPLCKLHVVEAGSGPPLIIVPATISECKDWIPLVHFMAQWFRVFFFELPGHGESTAFKHQFSTDLVAENVEQFADLLGIQNFSVMGFSFGGILACKVHQRLAPRINAIILIAPCLTKRAVRLSTIQKQLILLIVRFISKEPIRNGFLRLIHHPKTVTPVFRILQTLGRIESTIELRPKLLTISKNTIDVLGSQIQEILSIEFPLPASPYTTPCFFTMSVNDPTLDFETTCKIAKDLFPTIQIITTDEPYHQPPEPFTFESLNAKYSSLVENSVIQIKKNLE